MNNKKRQAKQTRGFSLQTHEHTKQSHEAHTFMEPFRMNDDYNRT